VQREDQVLHKISAPIYQRQPDGEEEYVPQLKKRGVMLPVFIDLINKRLLGQISFRRASFQHAIKNFPLWAGANDEADVIQRNSRTRIKKQIQGKDYQEQAQWQNVTLPSSRKVLNAQESGREEQGPQRTKNLGINMREFMQAVVQEVLHRKIMGIRKLLPAAMAVFTH
jgi:hypothetical protein